MIKLRSLLKEQQDGRVFEKFDFEFESGIAVLSRPGQVELSKIIAQIKNLINNKKYKESTLEIKINASESKVPNQPPYDEEEGSLAKARAKNLAAILKKEFPNIEVKATYQPKAQGPEYDAAAGDQKNDPKYKEFQKVTAQLELQPTDPQIPFSLIDLLYAIPTAEYTRMQGPEGSNTGTIKVYSTGRVNTAGTMNKSAAEYEMDETFKGLSELQSIVSRVATQGTGFEDRKYQKPMDPSIVNKAKQLLTVLNSMPTGAETWIVQNPQQAAELPGVSKPTSIQSTHLYAGEIRGFDNLTKFFTAVKNKV
jgi:hypothetical protein